MTKKLSKEKAAKKLETKKRKKLSKGIIVRELDKTLDLAYNRTFEEMLWEIALQIRNLIGAHQSAVSYIPNGNFKQAIHTHSFSKKYEKYNNYDVMPTGKGIWSVVVEKCVPMRMTDKELKTHPRWRNFSGLKNDRGLEHPPMRGWLAIPVVRQNSDFIGLLQLTDKYKGDFTKEDEENLLRFSRVIGTSFELYYTNSYLQENTQRVEKAEKILEKKVSELAQTNEKLSQEIIERKTYLKKLNEVNMALTHAMPGISTLDTNGYYVDINKVYAQMFGYVPSELIGKSWPLTVCPSDHAKAIAAHEKMKKKGKAEFEAKAISKDGSIFYKRVLMVKREDEEGIFIGHHCFAKDISKHKQIENELKLAKEQAEAASAAKTKFLANMSHEIRTPMNAIVGINSLLKNTTLNAQQSSFVEKIDLASQNLLGIINDILDFSKIEAQKLTIESIEFDLNDVLERVSSVFSSIVEEKGIELIFAIEQNVPATLIGDPLRLGQVLINLLNNAVKFTKVGKIIVSIDRLKDSSGVILQFCVKDTGIGISPQKQTKLFEAFSQGDDSTTRRYGGTGLGLTISKNLVQIMNGKIWVESQENKGSQFFFTTLFKKSLQERKIYNPPIVTWKKVLIIEKNKSSQKVLHSYLQQNSSDITTALSYKEAMHKLQNKLYNLIVVDKNIGKVSEIIEYVSNKDPGSKIIISSYSQKIEPSIQKKIHGVLSKPIVPKNLYETLSSMVKKSYPQTSKHRKIAKYKNLDETTILLVEDNEMNQLVASELLRNQGANVVIANNGKKAIELLEANKFDVILMDLHMPQMDGMETTSIIRKTPIYKTLPIIAMTADAMRGTKQRLLDIGFSDYITKPIDPDTLFSVIQKWLANLKNDKLGEVSKLKEINIQEGLERVAGNKFLYQKLLKLFCEEYKNFPLELEKLLKKHCFEKMSKLCQDVKETCGNLAIEQLYLQITNLEKEITKQNIKEIINLITTISKTFHQVTNGVQNNQYL